MNEKALTNSLASTDTWQAYEAFQSQLRTMLGHLCRTIGWSRFNGAACMPKPALSMIDGRRSGPLTSADSGKAQTPHALGVTPTRYHTGITKALFILLQQQQKTESGKKNVDGRGGNGGSHIARFGE